jgi:hypothetical protein
VLFCGRPRRKIPASQRGLIGEFKPTWFGFGKFKPGVKPADWELKE